MSDIMLADKAAFDAAIEATKGDGKPLIVDFTATWCPPCQMIGPKFVAHAESAANTKITFKKVDVDANGEAAQAAGIEAMPTFKVYKDGAEVVEDMIRGASEDKLNTLVAKYN